MYEPDPSQVNEHGTAKLLTGIPLESLPESVIDTIAEGIVVHDASGAIVMANPGAERVLGLTADQLMGRTPYDARWRAVHEDGSPFPGETHPAM